MPFNPPYIRKAAVLGAGMMGTQIAAHLANAGIETILYDLPSKEGDPNALVKEAVNALHSLHPAPLALDSLIHSIQPANYDHDLALLKDCELIIESIPERIDWKLDLYRKISSFISNEAIVTGNTSGISIETLSQGLPETLRGRFCGIHFFNPPRYMTLVELIPHSATLPECLEHLESFLVTHLGKGVIVAKDIPNFIGNRIGFFFLLSTILQADLLGLSPDIVDQLTGKRIGRPKSATFRTLDMVGLDVFSHIVNTMNASLPQDPWHSIFRVPAWIEHLIQKGSLGQKAKMGVYRHLKNELQVIDKQGNYRPSQSKINPELATLLQLPTLKERIIKCRSSPLNEAKFIWSLFRDLFHYSAYHLGSIAETARELDFAMRWGFGFSQGPFELWQTLGWKTVIEWIEQDIDAERSLCTVPLPAWVYELREGPYRNNTAFSPERGIFLSTSRLPVYARQRFPEKTSLEEEEQGKTIFEAQGLRLWTEDEQRAILSIQTTEKNEITTEILEGILDCLQHAEKEYRALILWPSEGKDFSVGTAYRALIETAQRGQVQALSKQIKLLQHTTQALRYSSIPTVAAIRGRVLGSACELMMHCSKTVAALESYPGFKEVGLGLIPWGGGCKEFAKRAALNGFGLDPCQILQDYFKVLFSSRISKSALEAKHIGLLREPDVIVMNPREVLHVALSAAGSMVEANYRPPLKRKIMAVGKHGGATLQVELIKLRDSETISDHDYWVGSALAQTLCGGEVDGGTEVTEEWILELERHWFIELFQCPNTQERITYWIEQGKLLKN